MTKTSYTSCATKPEEVVICSALDAGNYPAEYSERISKILKYIPDENLRAKVKQTLGEFGTGADGKLAQSSPYKLVVLQEIIPKGKVLVARPRLQIAKENNPDFMSGFYVDCDLNLVSAQDGYKMNPVPAKELAEDLKSVGIDLESAKLIPYHILTHEINENSPSGLVFKLSKEGKDTAKKLVLNTNDFNWRYNPSNSGLFRAYLDADGDWDAGDGDLANSNDDGRVVVETTGGAGSRELEDLKREAENLYNRQRKERGLLVTKLLA